jgi:hypothetical protein
LRFHSKKDPKLVHVKANNSSYLTIPIEKNMERIVIQVDEAAGQFYRQLGLEKQLQIGEALSLLLKKAANDATEVQYARLLDDFGKQATANGLTPAIVDELLKNGD